MATTPDRVVRRFEMRVAEETVAAIALHALDAQVEASGWEIVNRDALEPEIERVEGGFLVTVEGIETEPKQWLRDVGLWG